MFRAGDDYGAGSLTVCPNNNPVFGPGTYSVSVTGSFRVENTEMSLTIFLGEDRYPIAPPDDRYDCSTFPVEVSKLVERDRMMDREESERGGNGVKKREREGGDWVERSFVFLYLVSIAYFSSFW